MRILLLVIFFIVSFLSEICAQYVYTYKHEQAHNAILELEFAKANDILHSEKHTASKVWLASYSSFIEYLTTSSAIYPRKQITYYDEKIEDLNDFEDSPFQLLGIADNYLFKAYTHLTIKEYLWAGTSYLKAQRYMSKLESHYPEFYANSRNKLIHIMADAWMSENLPLVNRIESFELANNSYQKIQNEALIDSLLPEAFKRELKIVGVLLYPYIEQTATKVFKNANKYGKDWGNQGPIEQLAYVNFGIKAGKHELANECLRYGDVKGFGDRLNRLNLFIGSSYQNQLNDSSILYLNRFVSTQKNNRALVYAKLKQAWFYSISSNTVKSEMIVNEILNIEETFTVEDAQAVYEAKNFSNWNAQLLSARLLFDGGNYEESVSILSAMNKPLVTLNIDQQLEYHYRLARGYEKMKEYSNAMLHYRKTIAIGLEDDFYYNAYACFYLAQIYIESQEIVQAKNYLDKCVETNSPIYEASIHRKAKLQLRNLRRLE